MDDLRIDGLTVAQAQQVLNLYLAATSVERSGLARAPDELSSDLIASFLRQACEDGITLGAYLGDRLVGELHAARPGPRQFSHVLTGLTVAVHPDVQGRHVGTALFVALFERARAMVPPILRIELAARSSNTRALQLYRRLGFAEEGRLVGRVMLPDGRTEDDVVMACNLRAR